MARVPSHRAIDAENSRFGGISAARRVARTIFMGSAPHVRQQTARGIEDVRIRLGVAQPGEMLSVYNDAAGRMTNRLTHLYTGSAPLLVRHATQPPPYDG